MASVAYRNRLNQFCEYCVALLVPHSAPLSVVGRNGLGEF